MMWLHHKRLGITGCILLATGLGGCSLFGGSDARSLIQFTKVVFQGPDRIKLDEAAAVPYASIGFRVGDSNQIMLVLGWSRNTQQLWTSTAKITVVTRDGRIVETAGLGHDLGGYLERGTTHGADGLVVRRWLADYPDLGLYGVSIACEVQPPKSDTIAILGKDIRTLRVEEHCVVQDARLKWSFKNTFWKDPDTNLVWRSQQYVNPKLAVIEIETFRPEG